jgi:hypothetical protein
MGEGYTLKGGKYSVQAGDRINDAANLWSGAYASASEAWLEAGALGEFGEPARIRYGQILHDAMHELETAQNALIDVRETMYQIAGVYSKAEIEAAAKAARVRGRTHRPEIDDPAY